MKNTPIEIFLSSLRFMPPGGLWQFMWNRHGAHFFIGGIGFTFFIDFKLQREAAVMMLRAFPDMLNGRTVEDCAKLLSEFFVSQIEIIGPDGLLFNGTKNITVRDLIHEEILQRLNVAFPKFLAMRNKHSLYFMPITGLVCKEPRSENGFAWIRGNADISSLLVNANLDTGSHPTTELNKCHLEIKGNSLLSNSDSWFVVEAAFADEAETRLKQMTGALSVVLQYPQSRIFSGREMPRGRYEFKENRTISYNALSNHVPPVMAPLQFLENSDFQFWKLIGHRTNRVNVALQFLAEGWRNTKTSSFINNSIAMDALFGEEGKARKGILEGVTKFGTSVPHAQDKYNRILKIRNCLLHGSEYSIESSEDYLKYFELFQSNPVGDQILILNNCLLKLVNEIK